MRGVRTVRTQEIWNRKGGSGQKSQQRNCPFFMMNYKIAYPDKPNMGDLLNKDMLEDIFHIQVERGDRLTSNMSGIGSGLHYVQWSLSVSNRLKQIAYLPFAAREYHVWGTGFLNSAGKATPFYFSKMQFHCLRGKLTQNRVEAIIHQKLDIPLGDGGLLAERWTGPQKKKYRIGIIPHFREQDHPLVKKLNESYEDSTVIDLTEPPRTVVETIGSCEYILSSSLHGLIVADSFHIPNMHILFYPMGERIMGDGYKYSDYYSSFDLEDQPRLIDPDHLPTAAEIQENYKIDEAAVEKKKDELIRVFPR